MHVFPSSKPSTAGVSLALHGSGEPRTAMIHVSDLILAGWTGRNEAAQQTHIRELALLGIAAPRRRSFIRVGAALLTTAPGGEVAGVDSTGEVEFVVFHFAGSLWIGLGSDQTDRKVEALGITLSKQMCPKPLAPDAWLLSDVEAHWDELTLRSCSIAGGEQTLYQEGRVCAIRHPLDLIDLYQDRTGERFAPGTAMFGGTFGVEGGLRWSDTFVMELEDPVLGRRIRHGYDIYALPSNG